MAKYSLGTDDLAGLRWMALNSAKDILTKTGTPSVADVLAGAKSIETYILDQGSLDQIAADAATTRAAAEQAEADAINAKAEAIERLKKAEEATVAEGGGGAGVPASAKVETIVGDQN